MKKGTTILICVILALIATVVTLYPLISNVVSETNRSQIETQYVKAVEKLDDSEIREARMRAQGYNTTLLTVTEKPYTKEALERAAESYDDILNIRGDGIMGYVEIPILGVELPIYHGTEESTLDRGVGHLLGSSLPVGGLGTHCVLTGHSGLAGQKMFSDLDKLKKGDVFYLKTLDVTLAYMVLDINTVLPEDTSQLTIDSNRDSCTLITCTPYGINTHRLLVRGERIEYETAVSIVEEAPVEEVPLSTWTEDYLKGISYGLVGVASLTTVIGILWLKTKRKQKLRTSAGARTAIPTSCRHSDERRSHIHWESVSIQSVPQSAVQKTRSRKKRLRLLPKRKRGKHEKY